jgi:hypothetical protein
MLVEVQVLVQVETDQRAVKVEPLQLHLEQQILALVLEGILVAAAQES